MATSRARSLATSDGSFWPWIDTLPASGASVPLIMRRKRGLTRAVRAYQPQDFSGLYFEVDIPKKRPLRRKKT